VAGTPEPAAALAALAALVDAVYESWDRVPDPVRRAYEQAVQVLSQIGDGG